MERQVFDVRQVPEAHIVTLQASGQRSPDWHVDGDAENILQASVAQFGNSGYRAHWAGKSVLAREDMMMRLSSGSVAPAVIVILSTALLSSLSGTAMSQ